ncbi:MAG TPA: pseudouridine synthase, partial [Bacteroidia bacterium]|nr:pseudouridine synthase [Bacteroidia bacterium]
EYALSHLAKQFFERTSQRKYIALVWGDFDNAEGTVTGNVGRNIANRKMMDVFPNGEYGKHAVTHYKVLEKFLYTTLIECKLETGRTHQIRVHMKYIKHPLFNDFEYGGDAILRGTAFTRYKQFVQNCFALLPGQALHAATLGFVHPVTKKEMFFESPLPENFNTLIEKWRGYSRTYEE